MLALKVTPCIQPKMIDSGLLRCAVGCQIEENIPNNCLRSKQLPVTFTLTNVICMITYKAHYGFSPNESGNLEALLRNVLYFQNEVTILGLLNSVIRGYWNYEIVLDDWPNFSALVARPLQLHPRSTKVSSK